MFVLLLYKLHFKLVINSDIQLYEKYFFAVYRLLTENIILLMQSLMS